MGVLVPTAAAISSGWAVFGLIVWALWRLPDVGSAPRFMGSANAVVSGAIGTYAVVSIVRFGGQYEFDLATYRELTMWFFFYALWWPAALLWWLLER
jgi:hypothetical protein